MRLDSWIWKSELKQINTWKQNCWSSTFVLFHVVQWIWTLFPRGFHLFSLWNKHRDNNETRITCIISKLSYRILHYFVLYWNDTIALAIISRPEHERLTDENGPSYSRPTLELSQGQHRGTIRNMGCHAYGLPRACRYCLELKWTKLFCADDVQMIFTLNYLPVLFPCPGRKEILKNSGRAHSTFVLHQRGGRHRWRIVWGQGRSQRA